MKDNPSYQSIRKLLEKASLKPRKSDWDQMNVLLNKHLPPSGIHVNPLKFIKYFTGGASVVLITATVGFLHFHYSDKNKKSGFIIKAQENTNQFSEPEQESPKNVIFSKPKDSSIREFKNSQVETLASDKTNIETQSKDSSISEFKNSQVETLTSDKTNIETWSKDSSNNEINHLTAIRKKEKLTSSDISHQPLSAGPSKTAANYSTAKIKVQDENRIRKFRSAEKYPISPELSPVNHSTNPQNIGSRLHDSLAAGKKEKIKTGSSESLNKPGNKINSKHSPANAIFEYGLNLPLLQYYTSKDMQSIRVNYIPGITAQYFFNTHWGMGIDLNPYQTQNTNSRDSIFTMQKIDSAISINHYISNTYYIQNLNTVKLGVHLNYRVNTHFGLELGLGYQHSYNGNGFVTSKIIPDTFQLSIPNQHVHYTGNDTAFTQVDRSNFYYFMNAVYSFDKCDILLGYNQNLKSWTIDSPAKPAGWISLELRYYFSRPVRK